MSGLPDPPVPDGLDLYDMPDMPLDGSRLRDSKLVLKASGDEFRAAVLLWGAAWRQVPASSLPDDEDELCGFAGLGRDLKAWRKVSEWALHGFVKCSDGRIYHHVIAEKALAAIESRKRTETTKAKTRRRVREWRAKQRENDQETGDVTNDVTVTETLPIRRETHISEEKRSELDAAADARVPSLARQVEAIAGADGTTHANWHFIETAVSRWLVTDHSPEDILTGVRAAAAKRTASGQGPPNSPKFFDGPVADARAARLAPMPEGQAHAQRQKRPSRFDQDARRGPAAAWVAEELDSGPDAAGYG